MKWGPPLTIPESITAIQSSLRTSATPPTRALALATATCRAVWEKPQSGVTETRAASTYLSMVRTSTVRGMTSRRRFGYAGMAGFAGSASSPARGFAALFKLVTRAKAEDRQVQFREKEPAVRLGAEIVGLDQIAEIHENESENSALHAFAQAWAATCSRRYIQMAIIVARLDVGRVSPRFFSDLFAARGPTQDRQSDRAGRIVVARSQAIPGHWRHQAQTWERPA